MHLLQVLRRFQKLADDGLVYELAPGARQAELRETETRLQVVLPTQVKQFWAMVNGLDVMDPALEVLPLSRLCLDQGRLVFAHCDRRVPLAFDTSSLNVADQWSIVNEIGRAHV